MVRLVEIGKEALVAACLALVGFFACLSAGEALLLEASDELSLSLLLCGRAEAEQLAGDGEAAQRCWQRAWALAEPLQVDPATELGRALARLPALLELAREG